MKTSAISLRTLDELYSQGLLSARRESPILQIATSRLIQESFRPSRPDLNKRISIWQVPVICAIP